METFKTIIDMFHNIALIGYAICHFWCLIQFLFIKSKTSKEANWYGIASILFLLMWKLYG